MTRIALAVHALVVSEDDLADRPVALDLGDDLRALVGVHADDVPVLLRELGVSLEDAVREDELADVVQQSRRVDEVLLSSEKTRRARDLLRVARNRGAVTRGHPVPQVEGVEQRAQQTDLEAGELPRAPLQLLGSLLRDEELAQQVLEGEQDDREQDDRRQCRPAS